MHLLPQQLRFRDDQPPLEEYKVGDAVYYRALDWPAMWKGSPVEGWVRGKVTGKTLHPPWQESEDGLVIKITDPQADPNQTKSVKAADVQEKVRLLDWNETVESWTPAWAAAAAAAAGRLVGKTEGGAAKKRRKSRKRKSRKRKSRKRKSRKRKSRTSKSRK